MRDVEDVTGSAFNDSIAGDDGKIAVACCLNVNVNATTIAGNYTFSGTFTATITGNASTATALQTARTINGTSFDGTANITVTASAGTLTGSTLASGVTASSLTSLGSLTSLVVTGGATITGGSGGAGKITSNSTDGTLFWGNGGSSTDFILIEDDIANFMPNFGQAVVVVQPGTLKGSGPHGRIVKSDIEKAKSAPKAAPGCFPARRQFAAMGLGWRGLSWPHSKIRPPPLVF